MQTVSGIFALKDAAGRNRKQNPFCPLLPDFYYYRALTANTASKLAISVTMAIKWVRFPSIIAWIVRTLQTARAFAQERRKMHAGENSYFSSPWGVRHLCLSVHNHMENYPPLHVIRRRHGTWWMWYTSWASKILLGTVCRARRSGLRWVLKRCCVRGKEEKSNAETSKLTLHNTKQKIS